MENNKIKDAFLGFFDKLKKDTQSFVNETPIKTENKVIVDDKTMYFIIFVIVLIFLLVKYK